MALSVKDLGNRIIVSGTTGTKEKVKAGPMVITTVIWKGPTAIAHKANFIDNDGYEEFSLECSVADQTMSDDWPMGHATISDLYCDDLDSGTIIIYYKSHI